MQNSGQAVQSHYLQTILPFESTKDKPPQIMKNRQFYKPEKFIWNNPHRTSRKMYPYYHQANQQYIKRVKPLIQKLQEEDRKNTEIQRIQRLTKIRQQTRSKFFTRKKQREDLQEKVHQRGFNKQYAILARSRRKSEKIIAQYKNDNPYGSVTQRENTKQRLATLDPYAQSRYNQKSMEAYDKTINTIKNMIQNQLDTKRNKIREVFQNRKKKNQLSKIYINPSVKAANI